LYPSLFELQDKVSFEAVTGGVTKRVAAAAFLEVLQLKTWGRIGASQPAPFADIQLTRTHARAGSL
jgi:chromatin segregation and condensation protein Rec8/ScpA/Scc1 (kleisin family)